MARSTRRGLTGTAASAARRVIGLVGTAEPEPEPTADRAREKKAPATKKAPAKKAPAKKAPAKKAPAKKAAADKAPPKKAAATKTPAEKAPATKTPARRTPAETSPTPRKATPVTEARQKSGSQQTSGKKATAKAAGTGAASPKAAAKQAPLASLVVKEGEEAWTSEELAEVIDELHEQRDHSATIIRGLDDELSGLMRDSGDGAGQDQADIGSTSFERDHELTVLNNERDKVAQIERALGRIDDGTYGVCESCGEPIGKMRLMAFPRATLCMTCKQREERR